MLVARVTFLAVTFVAVFFAISSWALSVATGPSQIVGQSQKQGPGLLFGLSESIIGATFTDVLHVLYVTGMFACLLSFHNVVARYAFAMGREGLLPPAFGRTNPRSGAPAHGSLLQTVISLVAVVAFAVTDSSGAADHDPTAPVLKLFTWGGNVGALGIIVLLATTAFAVIGYFVRRGALRTQAPRIAASALAGIALVVIAVYAVKDFDVLVAGAGSAVSWVLPGIIGVTVVGGLGYGLVLRSTRPEMHARIGLGNEAFRIEQARETTDTEAETAAS